MSYVGYRQLEDIAIESRLLLEPVRENQAPISLYFRHRCPESESEAPIVMKFGGRVQTLNSNAYSCRHYFVWSLREKVPVEAKKEGKIISSE